MSEKQNNEIVGAENDKQLSEDELKLCIRQIIRHYYY
ncbi:MAG: hypothetical protein K0S55_347 [Clostridia bacterium]|nr:hypothetical protein [Clostridia bacterium]